MNNILYLFNDVNIGGSYSSMRIFGANINKRDLSLKVDICVPAKGKNYNYFKEYGLPVKIAGCPVKGLKFLKSTGGGFVQKVIKLFWFIFFVYRISRVVRSGKYRIVHVNDVLSLEAAFQIRRFWNLNFKIIWQARQQASLVYDNYHLSRADLLLSDAASVRERFYHLPNFKNFDFRVRV